MALVPMAVSALAMGVGLCQVRLPSDARCSQPVYEKRPWCRQHSRTERSLHKCYKLYTQGLLTWPSPQVTFDLISECDDSETLREWFEDCRKKLVITRRAIIARRRHHEMFYGGADAGHALFIRQLRLQVDLMEELLTAMDDKAYSLYVHASDALWLSDTLSTGKHHAPLRHDHGDEDGEGEDILAVPSAGYDEDKLDEHGRRMVFNNNNNLLLAEEGWPPTSAASSSAEPDLVPSNESSEDSDVDDIEDHHNDDDDDDDDFTGDEVDPADIEELLNLKPLKQENVCECCRHIELVERPETTYQQRLLNYFTFPDLFSNISPAEVVLAYDIISNIFRQVIARIPPLLVRAKASGHQDVKIFLSSDALEEHEHARLWRAMKQRDEKQEGKITPELIRSALMDAYNTINEVELTRTDPCVELLGGKVWKTPLETAMPSVCWSFFYLFVHCSCCAEGIMREFSEWALMQSKASHNGSWRAWCEDEQTYAESRLRELGFTLYWHEKEGGLKLEHVKPRVRGVKDVYIETETRNWCYLRLAPDNTYADQLLAITEEMWEQKGIKVLSWTIDNRKRKGEKHDSLESIWTSRLRSANSLAARRVARWTVKDNFCCMNCARKHMNQHAANDRLAEAPSVDFLVVDVSPGKKQSPEAVLERIIDLLELPHEVAKKGSPHDGWHWCNQDIPFKMGRKMFRENLHYKSA